MLIFAGTINQAGSKNVVSFMAMPWVDHSVLLADDVNWGKDAGFKGVHLAQQMLSQVAIAEVAEKYAKAYTAEVLNSLPPDKSWYILGDTIRRWLDMKLMMPNSAVPLEHTKENFGSIQ
jgi:hypothetical protein